MYVQQSIQETILRDPLRISLGTCFEVNGLIFIRKASRNFSHNSLGIKKRISHIWLSLAGEARDTYVRLTGRIFL